MHDHILVMNELKEKGFSIPAETYFIRALQDKRNISHRKTLKKSPIFAFSKDENQYISMGESIQLPLILSVTIFVQPFCDGRVRYDRFDTAPLMAP